MSDDKIRNFIDEMTSLKEVAAEMKKIGENYIKSKHAESRFLADWMYRFGVKIDELNKKETIKRQIKAVDRFVKTLETACEASSGSQTRFK